MMYLKLTAVFLAVTQLSSSNILHQEVQDSDDFVFTNCNKNPCNQVLQEFNRDEIITKMKQLFQDRYGALSIMFEPLLGNLLLYGVKIYKICASCSDFQLEYNDYTCFHEFCGVDAYGSSATVSGLLLVPLNKTGILKGGIWSHGTAAHTCNDIPSEGGWFYFQSDGFNVNLVTSVLMATAGNVVLAIDNLGYGESFDHHIGYVIRNQYKTSAVPLWLKAQQLVANESDCKTELSNSVVLGGYSEGGYGSVAIAEALDVCLGVNILKLFSAAGPLQMKSSFVEITKNVDLQSFPSSRMHYLVLVGTAFSKWYPEYPMLADEWRLPVMNLTTVGSSDRQMINYIPSYPSDPLLIMNQDFVTELLDSVAQNGFRICLDQTLNKTVRMDYFCQILIENDVSNYLLDVSYPFQVCHSPDDEVIPIANAIPLFLDHFFEAFGNHNNAAVPCIQSFLEYFVDPEFLDAIPEKSNQCTSLSLSASPSTNPTRVPIFIPTTAPVEHETNKPVSPTLVLTVSSVAPDLNSKKQKGKKKKASGKEKKKSTGKKKYRSDFNS